MAEDTNGGALKPVPALSAWLAYRQQVEQESIAAKVAAGMFLLWPILAFTNLKETTQTWVHASLLQVQSGWDESAVAAARFVEASRWAVEPEAPPIEPIRIEFPARDVAKALEATGPGRVRKLTPGVESEIMAKAQRASSGAGSTSALDGGREQVMGQVLKMAPGRTSSRQQIGWARVTDSNPCYFCAMLASLGAFFLNEHAFQQSDSKIRVIKRNGIVERRAFVGDGQAKVHDNCKCTLRAVFSESDSRDKRAKNFLNQWNDLTKGKSSFKPKGHLSEAMTAFREGYVSPPPYRAVDVLSDRRAVIDTARNNRDVLIRRGLGDDSPKVAFWEGAVRQLEAI